MPVFGKGEPQGNVAPETADQAAEHQRVASDVVAGRSWLGHHPGHDGRHDDLGLNPGPMLFIEQKDLSEGLIASMGLGRVVAVILALLTVPIFAALMRAPFFIIAPMIFIICRWAPIRLPIPISMS
jgi:TctA family transporter